MAVGQRDMEAWNDKVVRDRFHKRATELAQRLPSLKARASEMQSLRLLHDELLAKLSVYRTLLDQGSLDARDDLRASLTKLATSPPASPEAFDEARFGKLCQEFVAGLIGQYTR